MAAPLNKLSENMRRTLWQISRGLDLATGSHARIVVDGDGSRWWKELGAVDRRSLPALEVRGLIECRPDSDERFRHVWQVRLTDAGREALE